MYKVTSLVHLHQSTTDASVTALISAIREFAMGSIVPRSLIEPTLPGVRNGGDILVHLQFEQRDDWTSIRSGFDTIVDSPLVDHVDEVQYLPGSSGTRSTTSPSSVYRTLLLRVEDDVSEDIVRQFERETLRMPNFVSSMTSWQLSRVVSSSGRVGFTHVWEQEFTDMAGLMGPYLAHPVHWGYIDKWFDPECPEVIIQDRVSHSFCELDNAIIGGLVTELTA